MDGRALLELARALARVVHDGEYRRGSGEPYFNHVDRVAGRVYGWRAKTVAYLHDVIEDTVLTTYDLSHMGFPTEIISAVVSLSRDFYKKETYTEFIQRAIDTGDKTVIAVKLADLEDNLDGIDELDPKEADGLRRRYRRAYEQIMEAVDGGP